VLGLYGNRSGVVHGGQNEEIQVEDVEWLTKAIHSLMKTIVNRSDEFQDSEGTYIMALWLQDYRLTPRE
jgi:hypothetical protein